MINKPLGDGTSPAFVQLRRGAGGIIFFGFLAISVFSPFMETAFSPKGFYTVVITDLPSRHLWATLLSAGLGGLVALVIAWLSPKVLPWLYIMMLVAGFGGIGTFGMLTIIRSLDEKHVFSGAGTFEQKTYHVDGAIAATWHGRTRYYVEINPYHLVNSPSGVRVDRSVYDLIQEARRIPAQKAYYCLNLTAQIEKSNERLLVPYDLLHTSNLLPCAPDKI